MMQKTANQEHPDLCVIFPWPSLLGDLTTVDKRECDLNQSNVEFWGELVAKNNS